MTDDNKDEIEIVTDEENIGPDLQKKVKKLKEELKRCETERKEYLEGWQRAKADFINYRKDEQKRFTEVMQFTTAEFILELLPVLDSFDSALKHMPKEVEQGVLLVRTQFEDILKKLGLEQTKVVIGEDFSPELHESVGEMESDLPEGKIAEVIQKGYLLREKILRPARVKIAKSKIT